MGKIKNFTVGYDKTERNAEEKLSKIKKLEKKDGVVYKEIPYEDIVPNPENRDATKDLDKLADNISTFGLIHVLRVVEIENGKYQITSGERRWRAIGILRDRNPGTWETVPCTVGDIDTDKLDEEARLIVANNEVCEPTMEEYRKSVERLEEIYREKKRRGDYLPTSITAMIAGDLHIGERQVQKIRSVNRDLIPELKEYFDKEKITIDKANAISQLDEIYQTEILELLQEKGEISKSEIQAYKEEDRALRTENSNLRAEILEIRKQIKEQEGSERSEETTNLIRSLQEEYRKKMEKINRIVGSLDAPTISKLPLEEGRRMEFDNALTRLERSGMNIELKTRNVQLTGMDKQRIQGIIGKLEKIISN